jgi:hypothetical protein
MIASLAKFLLDSNQPQWDLSFGAVIIMAKVALCIPKDSCEAERGFSAMKRIKTYLRNCLSQNTLEHLMHCLVNGPDLSDIDECNELLDRALELWYNPEQGSSGSVWGRRVHLPGLKMSKKEKQSVPRFVWSGEDQPTQATRKETTERIEITKLKRKARIKARERQVALAAQLKAGRIAKEIEQKEAQAAKRAAQKLLKAARKEKVRAAVDNE